MERLRLAEPARRAGRSGRATGARRERARRPAAEHAGHGVEALGHRHAAGDDHRRVVRHVRATEVVEDRLVRHAGDGRGGAQDRPPVRVLAEVATRQDAPERGARRVLGAPDLLQHHVSLPLDLDRVERRVLGRVGEDVERRLEARGRQDDVEVRPVLGRGRVHLASEARDRLVDHARPAGRRPLEQQVLDEVRQPRLVRPFVACAGADPQLDRRHLRRVVRLENRGEAVWKAHALRRRMEVARASR